MLNPMIKWMSAHVIIMLFFLIKYSRTQSSTTIMRPASNPAAAKEPAGLCSKTNNTNQRLYNLTDTYHTPWLDDHFCSYPTRIHSEILDPDQECLPTSETALKDLLEICDAAADKRQSGGYTQLKLPFCSNYLVSSVFGGMDECVMKGEKDKCRQCMQNIFEIDQHVKFVYCHFTQDIMARFDCQNRFSVRWNCKDCQAAYRQWLCAMMIPFRMGRYLIYPCRTFCTMVEQRCPYLTPDDKVIYAGEPMFFCKDPDIPEIYSAYSDPPHCYQPCHLNRELEPKEACDHHELLVEELAIYYNMTRRKSSSSSTVTFSLFIVLVIGTVSAFSNKIFI